MTTRPSRVLSAACASGTALAPTGPGDDTLPWNMRVVGKRVESPGDREGLDALALHFGGGAPKGVFRYRTQEEANRDQERWLRERVQRRTKISSE